MRLKLRLELIGKKRTLPINYQYEIAAWIYKKIHLSDSQFSEWLHSEGYSYENKRFKQFTFSHLHVSNRRVEGDRLIVEGGPVEMQVSFAVDRSLEHFINGIFENQEMSIGDRFSRAEFKVIGVEEIAEPQFRDKMRFRCLSPICVARSNENSSATYIGPGEEDYSDRIGNNLLSKYKSVFPMADLSQAQIRILALESPKSRLVRIKSGSEAETFVRAFQFPFELSGPPELIRIAYQAGIGEKNSLGFGCLGEAG
ncbi:CRISPR-associated endoribonuclease Cas6 [Leptospira inadai]|nr:CRISPR-associated endoribonuclease Cas6 [Leptospira inadai]